MKVKNKMKNYAIKKILVFLCCLTTSTTLFGATKADAKKPQTSVTIPLSKCAVCYGKREVLVQADCGHYYHKSCEEIACAMSCLDCFTGVPKKPVFLIPKCCITCPQKPDKYIELSCGHQFHKSCLNTLRRLDGCTKCFIAPTKTKDENKTIVIVITPLSQEQLQAHSPKEADSTKHIPQGQSG